MFESIIWNGIELSNNIFGPEVIELDGSFMMYFSKDIIVGEDLSAETKLTEIGSASSVMEKIGS